METFFAPSLKAVRAQSTATLPPPMTITFPLSAGLLAPAAARRNSTP